MMGTTWRAAAALLLTAAILTAEVRASWKWGKDASQRPASASSVVTSSSSISTASSSSVAIGTREVFVSPKTSAEPDAPDAGEEGPETRQKSSRALDARPGDSASPPDLEEAPSDAEPRFIGHLKKKLCSVGLGFDCGYKSHKPASHNYVNPHDIQYVQPVEIRPVGKPVPAIPYKHGSSHGGGHGNSHGGGYSNSHGGGHGSSHGGGYNSHVGSHGNSHGGGHGSSHGGGYNSHGGSHGGGHGSSHGGGYNSHGGGHGSSHGSGYDSSHGGGHGSNHGGGHDSSHGGGHGSSHGSGYDSGHGSSYGGGYISHGGDHGSSHGGGYGSNQGVGHGTSHGGGHGSSYGGGYGNSHGGGHGNSHGSDHGNPFSNHHGSSHFESGHGSSGTEHFNGHGGDTYTVVSGPAEYGGPGLPPPPSGGGGAALHGSSFGYLEPQEPYFYGAGKSDASDVYGPPKAASVIHSATPSGLEGGQAPSSGYVASASSSLSSGQEATKHLHIHHHTYELNAAAGDDFGGVYDANNLIYGSGKSFSPSLPHVDAVAPSPDVLGGFYSESSGPGVQEELVRGVREPAGDALLKGGGCTCVPEEQCPQELASYASPFAREDLAAIQDPRNSPSVSGVLSNDSRPVLRRRRLSDDPQMALPSGGDLPGQGKGPFPDNVAVVHPSPYPNIKIVNSALAVQAPPEEPGEPHAASSAASFLSPTPSPLAISPGLTDSPFVGSQQQREGEAPLLRDAFVTNKEGVLKDCKGGQKKVRSRREAEEEKKEGAGQSSPRFLGGLLGGVTSGSGLDGFKGPGIAPSFGVNFGSLPTGAGYGPYGGNSNPLGLDLGPVSINPFVGFKVASLDGRPILNPSLDLLVTPNAKGVHALKGLKDKIKYGLDPFKGGHGGGYYPGGYYPGGQYSGGYYPYGGYPASPYQQYGGYQQSYYPQSYAPKPVYTPPKPVYVPPKPVYVPPKPAYVPPKPVYVPPKPVYTPPKPVYTRPTYRPSYHRPKPIADYGNRYKPVEVLHHHQHTHYHDFDRYDDDDYHYSPYDSGSFSSPFGRSDLKGSSSSRLPPSSSSSSPLRPIAAPSSSSSRLPSSFQGSASTPVHSTISARSDTGTDSDFKFPDS